MTALTDPARELADVCSKLASGSGARGDDYLASAFDVPAWSPEFYQILFCIAERADFVISLVNELDLDEDFKEEAASHVRQVKQAFNLNAMSNAWSSYGLKQLGPENLQPIKMLSPMIRQNISYPKLSDKELQKLLGEIEELSSWLSEHQTKEQDFIRQAILDGLLQFQFRLARVGWVGWGYTLESLREVIGAYMALERGLSPKDVDPVAKAVLKKVAAFVKTFYETTQFTKGVVETGDFMLRAYAAVSLITHGGSIAGLISSAS